jgi:hypothetical protein
LFLIFLGGFVAANEIIRDRRGDQTAQAKQAADTPRFSNALDFQFKLITGEPGILFYRFTRILEGLGQGRPLVVSIGLVSFTGTGALLVAAESSAPWSTFWGTPIESVIP